MTGREQPKMKEYYRVYADIDLDAIYENVKNAKALLKKDTKMMSKRTVMVMEPLKLPDRLMNLSMPMVWQS